MSFEKKLWRYDRFAILGLALIAAFVRIDVRSLWFDEIFLVDLVSKTWGMFWDVIFHREFNMVLYSIVLKLWTSFFDISDVFLRMLSVFFFAASASIFHSIAERFLSRWLALLAVIIFIMNPFLLRYGQEVRSYSMFLMLSLASTRYFIDLVQGKKGVSALYVMSSVMSVYAHFFGVFLIAAHGVAYLFIWRMPYGISHYIKMNGAIFLCLLPCFLFALFNGGNIGWISTPKLKDVYVLVFQMFPYSRYLPLLICFLVILQLVKIFCNRKVVSGSDESVSFLFVLCIIFPVLLVFLLSFKKPMFIDRYFIFCLPYILLLAVKALESIPVRFAMGVGVLLVLLSGFSIVRYWEGLSLVGEDWKGAAGELVAQIDSEDVILVYPSSGEISLGYYLDKSVVGRNIAIKSIASMQDEGWEGGIRDMALASSRVWVVIRHPYEKSQIASQLVKVLSDLNRKPNTKDRHAVSLTLWTSPRVADK